jgi:Zn-dependent metalloprotease
MLHFDRLRIATTVMLLSGALAPVALAKSPQGARTSRPAAQEAAPAPDVAPRFSAFTARREGPLAATWSARTGRLESLYGSLSERTERSERGARAFLSENAVLFGMGEELADLVLARSVESPLGTHLFFEQRVSGLPVFDAAASVHVSADGRVVGATSSYVPGVALRSVEPELMLHQVLARLADDFDAWDLRHARGELGVFAAGGSPALAWRVSIASEEGPTWELFVDAASGAWLSEPRDVNRYVNGTGQVFRVNAVVATHDDTLTDQRDAASAVPQSAYMTVTLQGLDGSGFLDGTYASSAKTKKRASSATNTFLFDRSSDGFSETMGYYYIDYAERYIQSLGFANVNARQQVFSVNSFKQDNSFYSPSTKNITYGTGGVDDAEDAEVILHEYGHSIQDNQVPGFGSTEEGGSMGEGFGDYWGGSVNAQLSGGFQDLCLAEWDATSYSSTNPPCLRRLDGTKHYPEDVVGEVHADGEIWSAALWQIRASIGATKADKVVLQAHFLLAANATFNQGANAIVTAATSLGYTTSEVSSIKTILRNRGFTVP